MRTLEFIGNDFWSCPVYKDEAGKLWKDVNLGYGEPSLHDSVGNDFEGEPNNPIEGDYTISASGNSVHNPDDKFRIALLARLKSDCDYYLGNGNRNLKHLWAKNEHDHIHEMKGLFDSFSDAERRDFNIDDWISREMISSYESSMLGSNAMQRSPDDYSNSIEAAKSNAVGNKNIQEKQDPFKSADVLR
jgi:hypothetical protein